MSSIVSKIWLRFSQHMENTIRNNDKLLISQGQKPTPYTYVWCGTKWYRFNEKTKSKTPKAKWDDFITVWSGSKNDVQIVELTEPMSNKDLTNPLYKGE